MFIPDRSRVSTFLTYAVMVTSFGLFFWGGFEYQPRRSFRQAWNLGHILFFVIWTWVVTGRCHGFGTASWGKKIVWIFSISLILGIAIELVQMNFNRSPSIGDVRKDLVGSFAALAFLSPTPKKGSKASFRIFKLFISLILVLEMLPLARALTDEATARAQFPVLSSFETPFEIHRWAGRARGEIDHEIAFHGNASMKIVLNLGIKSGIQLDYFPSNWHDSTFFHFSIYNPSPTSFKIECRLHDVLHDKMGPSYDNRFNTSIILSQGWNHIDIPIKEIIKGPKSRDMDIGKMKGFGLFVIKINEPRTIYIDDVRLVFSENKP